MAAISIMASAGIGLLLVYASEVGLALCVLMPMLCFLQKSRYAAFRVSLCYYASASSLIIPGTMAFFGSKGTLPFALTLWGTASALLALPFAVLWSADRYSSRGELHWLSSRAFLHRLESSDGPIPSPALEFFFPEQVGSGSWRS